MRVSRAGQGIPLAGNAKKKIGKLKSGARGVFGFQDAGDAVLRVAPAQHPVGQRRRLRLSTGQRHHLRRRSEERRVGKEWVSTCRSRWSTYTSNTTTKRCTTSHVAHAAQHLCANIPHS